MWRYLRQRRRTAPINFVLNRSPSYLGVQEDILGLVQKHLDSAKFSTSRMVARAGTLNFTLFIDIPGQVVMSHGAADKSYFFRKNASDKLVATNHEHILVPGQWLRRRLVNSRHLPFGDDQVHVVGWPRLDKLIEIRRANPRPERGNRRPKVLWAPTHDYYRRKGTERTISSYPAFEAMLPELERHCDVEVSLHPRNRPDKKPTFQKLLDADVVISDFGTMVYEAWALGTPVIFPDFLIGEAIEKYLSPYCAEGKIFQGGIGLHARSFAELLEFCMSATGVDEKAQAFLDDYLAPEYLGRSGQRVAEVLLELSARRPAASGPLAGLRRLVGGART